MDRILRINSKKIVKRLANSSLKTERRRNIMVIISIILATFLISMCGVGIFASSQRQKLLYITSDLDLPDGDGFKLLEIMRLKKIQVPFLFLSCHEKEEYETRALEKGANLCMNKLSSELVKETLLEYAYKESCGEGAAFHKILLVKKNSETSSVMQTELLKKGVYTITAESIGEAKNKLLEHRDIELILCDLFMEDGIAMDFLHSMRKVAGIFKDMKNPRFRELPFFIFTDNRDLSLEYRYRHEGVSDYITSPVNIPELIRRICYFVEG